MIPNTHDVLRAIVAKLTCKPGWRFDLYDLGAGLTLVISVRGPDSRKQQQCTVCHSFPAPMATYSVRSWRRWIFECCRKVEDHELMEWFIHDGVRTFAPLHGPGENPYDIRELETAEEAATNQDGTVTQLLTDD